MAERESDVQHHQQVAVTLSDVELRSFVEFNELIHSGTFCL